MYVRRWKLNRRGVKQSWDSAEYYRKLNIPVKSHQADGFIHRDCAEPDQRLHDDVSKWKHFPRYWPFVRGIHRSTVNSPHKGQWRGALMFSLICVWINRWVNNGEAGDFRRYRAHYDVIVMFHVKCYLYDTHRCCLFCNLSMIKGMVLTKDVFINVLTHLTLVPHICVSESGQHWFKYMLVAYSRGA